MEVGSRTVQNECIEAFVTAGPLVNNPDPSAGPLGRRSDDPPSRHFIPSLVTSEAPATRPFLRGRYCTRSHRMSYPLARRATSASQKFVRRPGKPGCCASPVLIHSNTSAPGELLKRSAMPRKSEHSSKLRRSICSNSTAAGSPINTMPSGGNRCVITFCRCLAASTATPSIPT